MSKRSPHPAGGGKMTQQHMAAATDINRIMDKHLRTGVLGTGVSNGRQPRFDFVSGESFHEMLLKVQEAQGAFATLPAKVRRRFANNPENLIRFLADEKNLAEAIELGLVNREDLPAERVAQLDLVKQAEARDRQEFEAWRRRRNGDELDSDEDLGDDANSVPTQPDPEANPRKSRNNRT